MDTGSLVKTRFINLLGVQIKCGVRLVKRGLYNLVGPIVMYYYHHFVVWGHEFDLMKHQYNIFFCGN